MGQLRDPILLICCYSVLRGQTVKLAPCWMVFLVFLPAEALQSVGFQQSVIHLDVADDAIVQMSKARSLRSGRVYCGSLTRPK